MVNISATLDYTYPTETVDVNAGDTLFISVSGPQYLTSWYVSSSSGFSSISPTSASSPGTCTAVIQSTSGSYSIQFLGQYYDYDAFSYIDVGYTINGTIAGGGTPPPPPPPPPPPATTYSLNFYDPSFSAVRSNFNEGESVYAFLQTTAPSGTYYWNTSSGSDLISPVDGAFTVDSSGYGLIAFTISADSTTEGGESLTFYVRSGSVSGTVLVSSAITINDTSTTPTPPPPPPPPPTTPTYSVGNASTNEGASANVTVSTTNVANGTTLYWTVDASTADVSTTSGSFAISSNVGSFTIPAIADSSTEGTEYYTISVRIGSTGGTVVASSTLTINDTSTTPVASDTTPNAFIFADQNDVPVSSTIVSAEIEILGINSGAPISITGGEYSIGLDPTTYTAYTSAPGTIYNTQTVKVRHTSSSANNTPTSTTLMIGGVSDVFTSTTIGAVGSGNYGLIVYDTLGNIMLDTTDITIKDLGVFTIPSVTTNGTITGVPLTSNSIALVNNNNGDGDTAIAAPAVTLAPASSSIIVSGGTSGFNVSIRVMEF